MNFSKRMSDPCGRIQTGLADQRRPSAMLLQFLSTALSLMLLLNTGLLRAHEYWLDPVGSQWQIGDLLQADIRNGDDFVGTAFPFDPESLARAGLISDSKRQGLRGRLGDYPAFQLPVQEEGIHLLLLETTQRQITYDDLEAFEKFLGEHSLDEFSERHQQRDLPETDISETYYRYCKALLTVSSSSGTNLNSRTSAASNDVSDAVDSQNVTHNRPTPALQLQDQRLELVVAENPLGSETVSVQVLFEGVPLADRQIELFHRNESSKVEKTIKQSDDEGYAQFSIAAAGDYLLNSVWIEESPDSSAHWTTYWASLFFQQTNKQDD